MQVTADFAKKPLLLGSASFIADIHFPKMAEMVIFRSTVPHARITNIDIQMAKSQQGVLAIITAKDLPRTARYLPPSPQIRTENHQPVLAIEEVHFVGEPVVAVVATNKEIALKACEGINISYQIMPAVVDANITNSQILPDAKFPNHCAEVEAYTFGDINQAFANASEIIKEQFSIQRQCALPLETRGVIANITEQGATLYTPTQLPHYIRSNLAQLLDRELSQIHVKVPPNVGGSFGARQLIYSEDVLALFLAQILNRPVRWLEDDAERFVATVHARQQHHHVQIALDDKGTILGIRAKINVDNGAYLRETRSGINTLHSIGSGYQIHAYEGKVHYILTNKPPVGVYRGAGHPQAVFVTERILEIVARHLKEDPVAFRQRHLMSGMNYSHTKAQSTKWVQERDIHQCLDEALRRIDYQKWRQQQHLLRQKQRYLGIGVTCFTSLLDGSARDPEFASIEIDLAGNIVLCSGTTEHGQGIRGTLANCVSTIMSVPASKIRVVLGDTSQVRRGWGCYASRGAAVAVSAAQIAAKSLRDKLAYHAAQILRTPQGQLQYGEQKFFDPSTQRSVNNNEIMRWLHQRHDLTSLKISKFYAPTSRTASVGVHLAVVEVEETTGIIDVTRYLVVQDSGVILQPRLAEGQIIGGIVQGMGGALTENLIYNRHGYLETSFATYGLLSACQIPSIQIMFITTPSETTYSQALGIGESGTIASFATIVNAVDDAVVPFNIRLPAPPLTPERLWIALQTSSNRGMCQEF